MPLMLQYECRRFQLLHQDLYGDVSFPLQWYFCLAARARWGRRRIVCSVEQTTARAIQGQVVVADCGQAIIFTTRDRPVKGSRRYYRVNLRHGVSRGASRHALHAGGHFPRREE